MSQNNLATNVSPLRSPIGNVEERLRQIESRFNRHVDSNRHSLEEQFTKRYYDPSVPGRETGFIIWTSGAQTTKRYEEIYGYDDVTGNLVSQEIVFYDVNGNPVERFVREVTYTSIGLEETVDTRRI